MGFEANLTITGLCVLVTDDDRAPRFAELLLVDTSDARGHHRHHPYMAFFTDSRGNLGNIHRPALPGWEEYVIGPDGRAITRVLLENTIVRLEARTESGRAPAFTRDRSLDRVPDLRRLGVRAINLPSGGEFRIRGATSRVALPSGTLSTSGEVRDLQGDLIRWREVGVIAELVHLRLQGLSSLRMHHGANSFALLPLGGRVDLGISNDPASHLPSTFSGEIAVPHFDMYGRVADRRPMLVRDGDVTPSNPACPNAGWVQSDFPFLASSPSPEEAPEEDAGQQQHSYKERGQ